MSNSHSGGLGCGFVTSRCSSSSNHQSNSALYAVFQAASRRFILPCFPKHPFASSSYHLLPTSYQAFSNLVNCLLACLHHQEQFQTRSTSKNQSRAFAPFAQDSYQAIVNNVDGETTLHGINNMSRQNLGRGSHETIVSPSSISANADNHSSGSRFINFSSSILGSFNSSSVMSCFNRRTIPSCEEEEEEDMADAYYPKITSSQAFPQNQVVDAVASEVPLSPPINSHVPKYRFISSCIRGVNAETKNKTTPKITSTSDFAIPDSEMYLTASASGTGKQSEDPANWIFNPILCSFSTHPLCRHKYTIFPVTVTHKCVDIENILISLNQSNDQFPIHDPQQQQQQQQQQEQPIREDEETWLDEADDDDDEFHGVELVKDDAQNSSNYKKMSQMSVSSPPQLLTTSIEPVNTQRQVRFWLKVDSSNMMEELPLSSELFFHNILKQIKSIGLVTSPIQIVYQIVKDNSVLMDSNFLPGQDQLMQPSLPSHQRQISSKKSLQSSAASSATTGAVSTPSSTYSGVIFDYLVQELPPFHMGQSNRIHGRVGLTLSLLRVLWAINRFWFSFDNSWEQSPIINMLDFHSAKLNVRVRRQLRAYAPVLSGDMPRWLHQLMASCPFLFSFDTRRDYFFLHLPLTQYKARIRDYLVNQMGVSESSIAASMSIPSGPGVQHRNNNSNNGNTLGTGTVSLGFHISNPSSVNSPQSGLLASNVVDLRRMNASNISSKILSSSSSSTIPAAAISDNEQPSNSAFSTQHATSSGRRSLFNASTQAASSLFSAALANAGISHNSNNNNNNNNNINVNRTDQNLKNPIIAGSGFNNTINNSIININQSNFSNNNIINNNSSNFLLSTTNFLQQNIQLSRKRIHMHRETSLLGQVHQQRSVFLNSAAREHLEVQFHDEAGFGSGPTQEFYTLLSREFQRLDLQLWHHDHTRTSEIGENYVFALQPGLYPRPLPKRSKLSHQIRDNFRLLGAIMARALIDQHKLDIPLSALVYKWLLLPSHEIDEISSEQNHCTGGHSDSTGPIASVFCSSSSAASFSNRHFLNESVANPAYPTPGLIGNDISFVDPELANQLHNLNQLILEREQILLDLKEARINLTSATSKIDRLGIDDLFLVFVLPGYEIELLPNGRNTPVTAGNLSLYLRLVMHWFLYAGVHRQFKALREGFQRVLDLGTNYSPAAALRMFQPQEMEQLFCGYSSETPDNSAADSQWNLDVFLQCFRADHGYTLDSLTVRNLFKIMIEFNIQERRLFLQFVTGSPRLPVGGFRALKPPLTIVMKKSDLVFPVNSNSMSTSHIYASASNSGISYGNLTESSTLANNASTDEILPSVMTCQSFLKLPNYSSLEKMREKLNFAIREGQHSFHLS